MEIPSNIRLMKIEVFLRLCALLSLVLGAIVMATDKQSKIYFGVYKQKVNYKLANIFEISVYVHSIGAAYNLLQLVRCLAFTKCEGDKLSLSGHILKWMYFLLDQMAVYLVFAIICASTQLSLIAIFGIKGVQWMKQCNQYAHFCFQIGVSVACSFVAVVILIVISGISTFNLFRWYSPNFLCLKPKKIGIVASY